ncbi:hypothetical protein F2P81_026026 [Scophthalmus maximus]|uniref:Uncharacterized protein n=1 Tax=Scophthalmus maximus TaxID=52904 RepID=A0A6A4RR54_SCOMX|nr:hypothetical protein F2P81_026026 [Scophthalmus maximus]
MVEKAKLDVVDLLKNGRAFSYAVITQIMADANPIQRLTEELERHHLIVTGAPHTLPNANATAGPSPRQPTGAAHTLPNANAYSWTIHKTDY